jgi:hypothetical protein
MKQTKSQLLNALNGASIFGPRTALRNSGTSEGVKKAWDTRRHGAFDPSGDTRQIFGHITDRKPADEHDLHPVNASDLHPDQLAALRAKPIIRLSSQGLLADNPVLKEANNSTIGGGKNLEFHGVDEKGQHYYVNTEGSNYARYAQKINGYTAKDAAPSYHANDVPAKFTPDNSWKTPESIALEKEAGPVQSTKEFGQQIATGSGGTHLQSTTTATGRKVHLIGVEDPMKSANSTATFIKHGAFGATGETKVEHDADMGISRVHFNKGGTPHTIVYAKQNAE